MTGPRIHATELLNEMMRLFEVNLKASLSLACIARGDIGFLPNVNGISDLVNGIFVNAEPSTIIEPVQYPTDLLVTYQFRILHLMKIAVDQNVLSQKEANVKAIVEMVFDNFTLSALSLTNGQVLWWLPTEVEWEPPEDAYINEKAAEIVAVAFKTECKVRTRR